LRGPRRATIMGSEEAVAKEKPLPRRARSECSPYGGKLGLGIAPRTRLATCPPEARRRRVALACKAVLNVVALSATDSNKVRIRRIRPSIG